jgi:hypothetical protein
MKNIKKALDEYLKEEYKKANPKPNGMMGHWGWYAMKTREFKEKWKSNKVNE